MKKILPVLILLTLVLPVVAFAVPISEPLTTCTMVRTVTLGSGATQITCTKDEAIDIDVKGQCCAINAIYRISDVIFIVLVGLTVIFFLLGAGTLVIAAGAPERVEKGRSYILYAIVGLAVALLARAVPAVAKFFIGG